MGIEDEGVLKDEQREVYQSGRQTFWPKVIHEQIEVSMELCPEPLTYSAVLEILH